MTELLQQLSKLKTQFNSDGKELEAQNASPAKWNEGLGFVLAMWASSRLLIILVMQAIAPSLDLTPKENYVPTSGWDLFVHWDGTWYGRIATEGYNYANDSGQSAIAFFPLFPLLSRLVMGLGLPFKVAGPLVSSLAFLGALLVLYRWAKERQDVKAARWATAVMAWFPYSIFGLVAYTEGLFLLTTTASLQAFDRRQYRLAILWGALATATRVPGIALIPTYLWVAWREKRPAIAYFTALATSLGLVCFILFCTFRFGEPLAFVIAQKGWADLHESWWSVFRGITHLRIKAVLMLGSPLLFWWLRHRLGRVAVTYGFCSIAILLASQSTWSCDRFVYGIVTFSLALGTLLSRYSPWSYAAFGLFTVDLVARSIRFAWWHWVS
jgi:Gpi18-like mannosyltransferase